MRVLEGQPATCRCRKRLQRRFHTEKARRPSINNYLLLPPAIVRRRAAAAHATIAVTSIRRCCVPPGLRATRHQRFLPPSTTYQRASHMAQRRRRACRSVMRTSAARAPLALPLRRVVWFCSDSVGSALGHRCAYTYRTIARLFSCILLPGGVPRLTAHTRLPAPHLHIPTTLAVCAPPCLPLYSCCLKLTQPFSSYHPPTWHLLPTSLKTMPCCWYILAAIFSCLQAA